MTSLLLYAYCVGERSSRKIEKLCQRDIAFRVIAANEQPDHSTISRFRKFNETELAQLFIDVLKLCVEAGLAKAGTVALDGTKIKANASLAANRTSEHIEKEVEKMLTEAAAKDAEEDKLYGKDKRGDELPDDLQKRDDRLARLKECKKRLDKQAQETAAKQQEKLDKRQAEEAATGRKKRGRKPKTPEKAADEQQQKANVTDPASRIMKTRKGYEQGYNGQAACNEEQVILAAEVTDEANDVKQLHPMMNKTQANLTAAGSEDKTGAKLADAGYWSNGNMEEADVDGAEFFIATKKDWKQRKAMREAPPPRGRIPRGLSGQELMERKLLTKRGRELYKKRSGMIEPVFGQIKSVRGVDRFMRRGLAAVSSEWKLICATHNLLKLWRSGKTEWN